MVTEQGLRIDPDTRRRPGRRLPDPAAAPASLPGAEQAPRGGLHPGRPGGPAHARRPAGRGTQGSGCSTSGRLDTDTEGLLILTNDGEFAHRLAHPSYEVPKTYLAEVAGVVTHGRR